MKAENRELLNRVIGTIDGMCFLADEPMKQGLITVSDMLCEILDSEVKNDD